MKSSQVTPVCYVYLDNIVENDPLIMRLASQYFKEVSKVPDPAIVLIPEYKFRSFCTIYESKIGSWTVDKILERIPPGAMIKI